jgi:hypothetical protein
MGHSIHEGDDVVKWAVGQCVERGVDFEAFLPTGKEAYTAREIVNACGDALTSIGVPNNLRKDS